MKLTKAEKTDFAIKLKAKLNEAFAAETQSSQTEFYYMGVCKITATLEQEFVTNAGEFPAIVNGACHLARGFLNPDQIESKEDIKKGMGLLVSTAGGLSIVWGVLTMAHLTVAICILVFGIHPMLAPAAIIGGMAAAVAGVYAALAKQPPQARLAKAHDVLIEAITKWQEQDAAQKIDADLIRKTASKVQRVAIRDFEGKYVCADLNKGGNLIADRDAANTWEIFTLFELGDGKAVLMGCNNLLVSAVGNGDDQLVSNQSDHLKCEQFEIRTASAGGVNLLGMTLRAANGKYVSCRADDGRLLKACAETPSQWEQFHFMPVFKPS